MTTLNKIDLSKVVATASDFMYNNISDIDGFGSTVLVDYTTDDTQPGVPICVPVDGGIITDVIGLLTYTELSMPGSVFEDCMQQGLVELEANGIDEVNGIKVVDHPGLDVIRDATSNRVNMTFWYTLETGMQVGVLADWTNHTIRSVAVMPSAVDKFLNMVQE